MKHEFSDTLRADPERFELARRAAAILDEATRDTIFQPHATWDFAADENNALELRIRGIGDIQIERGITVRESEDPLKLKWRMLHTWSEWLQESSDRRIERWRRDGTYPPEFATA